MNQPILISFYNKLNKCAFVLPVQLLANVIPAFLPGSPDTILVWARKGTKQYILVPKDEIYQGGLLCHCPP
jgi:hypothetical protein